MRRILTVLALAVALSTMAVPAYAESPHRDDHHGWAHHRGDHHGWDRHHASAASAFVIDRLASPIGRYAPGVEPEPTFPFVTVRARLRGCEPGRLYLVHATFHQRHREISGIVGGRGFEEFGCGADGTALVSQSRYDPDGRLHRGRLRVSFQVLTWEQDVVVATATARVRIPRR